MSTTGLTGYADATAIDRHLALLGGVGTITAAANLTLTAGYGNLLRIDPGGAHRNVGLPAEATSNGFWYLIENTADAAENLTIRDDTPANVIVLGRQEVALVYCDGTTWHASPVYRVGGLTAAAVAVAADSFHFLDATDSALKLESFADLATAMAGAGLTALAGVLSCNPTTNLSITGTIATAAVKTLNATPVEVIPTPGVGKYIEVVSCHWFLDFAAAGYDAAAAGDALVLKYTNAGGDEVVAQVPGNTIGAAVADYHTVVQAVQGPLIPVANAAIVAHILVGEWFAAAGDSPLKYEIVYRVHDLAI
jgi:hypothetical protein